MCIASRPTLAKTYYWSPISIVFHTTVAKHEPQVRFDGQGEALANAQSVAEDNNFGLILVHSHPSGFSGFSSIDDASDQAVIPSIYNGWLGREPAPPCGSAVMTPDGAIRARIYDRAIRPHIVDVVSVIGDDILRMTDDNGKASRTGVQELWPRVGDGLREGGGVSWGVTKPPGLQARSDTP